VRNNPALKSDCNIIRNVFSEIPSMQSWLNLPLDGGT
jgi:hypothetical protein